MVSKLGFSDTFALKLLICFDFSTGFDIESLERFDLQLIVEAVRRAILALFVASTACDSIKDLLENLDDQEEDSVFKN